MSGCLDFEIDEFPLRDSIAIVNFNKMNEKGLFHGGKHPNHRDLCNPTGEHQGSHPDRPSAGGACS